MTHKHFVTILFAGVLGGACLCLALGACDFWDTCSDFSWQEGIIWGEVENRRKAAEERQLRIDYEDCKEKYPLRWLDPRYKPCRDKAAFKRHAAVQGAIDWGNLESKKNCGNNNPCDCPHDAGDICQDWSRRCSQYL